MIGALEAQAGEISLTMFAAMCNTIEEATILHASHVAAIEANKQAAKILTEG